MIVRALIVGLLLNLAVAAVVPAAEIVLRDVASSATAITRLGDVADVYAADKQEARKLRDIELFPAPATGKKRFARAREIQDTLIVAGVNVVEHRLSGASQVEVRGPESQAVSPSTIIPVNGSMVLPATAAVRVATIEYLEHQVGTDAPWNVEPQLNDELVRAVNGKGAKVTVRGAQEPWIGRQSLVAVVHGGEGDQEYTFEANVMRPPAVVMAVRPIARGQLIGPDDVKLEHPAMGAIDGRVGRLDEVVGQEATRMIASGQFLDRDWVKRPLMVKRGDAVVVTARSRGLRVHMMGRSREDGAIGDVVSIESQTTKDTIFARVTGLQEVEVFARAVDARANPAVETAQEQR